MGLQAGTILLFGIGTPEQTYGLLQNYSIDSAVKRVGAKAPDGHVISIQEFGDEKFLDLTYIPIFEGTGDPVIGSTFTFDGLTWKIDNINEFYNVSGFLNISVSATYYPQI